MAVTPVLTARAVNQLAAGLFDGKRTQPWVVVTSGFASSEPEIPVGELLESIGDVTQIFTIQTGELTRQLSDLLPERLQVYGGAGRSYPVGFTAEAPPGSSRLRFPQPTGQRAAEQLIADALGHAQAAGLFAKPPASSRPAAGTIAGFLAGGERAMVSLEHGNFLVNTGAKLVMVDCGGAKMLGPHAGRLPAALAQLGIAPDQIDEVYVTHMHGDLVRLAARPLLKNPFAAA